MHAVTNSDMVRCFAEKSKVEIWLPKKSQKFHKPQKATKVVVWANYSIKSAKNLSKLLGPKWRKFGEIEIRKFESRKMAKKTFSKDKTFKLTHRCTGVELRREILVVGL